MTKRIAVVAAVILVLLALLGYSQWRRPVAKVSGFIEADQIRLGSRVGGRVASVEVEEGNRVEAGATLLTLEPYDLDEREAEARAQLDAAQKELDKMRAGFRPEEIAQAQARVDQLRAHYDKLMAGPREEEIAAGVARRQLAQAQLVRAQSTYQSVRDLFVAEQGAVSRDDLDRATEDLKVAESALEVRKQELLLLERGTRQEDKDEAAAQLAEAQQALLLAQNGYRQEDIDKALATRDAAQAALDAIRKQREELVVKASIAGIVESIELRPGDLVTANAPIVTITDIDRLWVRAYLPEDELDVKQGDKLRVTIDSFAGEDFLGEVTYVSPQAEFVPGNVQTPEDRSQQVFRIKVMLSEGKEKLRPGMAADVWLRR
jgi:multidrug resistance efflux pump